MAVIALAATLGVLVAALAAAPARADVAFSSNRCVAGECRTRVWTMADDGAGARPVTDPPPMGGDGRRVGNEADVQPSWSPLAGRLAFARYGGQGAQAAIHTVARDGTEPRRLSPPAPGGDLQENWPDWSPLGALIAFESNRPVASGSPGSRRIWVAAPDGSAARPLTGDGWAHLPRFTPDGLHVMYSDLGDGSRVKSVPVAGGPSRPVVAGDLQIGPFALAVSPDGRTLAVGLNGPDGPGLYLVDAATGGLRKLSGDLMAGASWAGDGALFSSVSTGPATSAIVRLDARGDGIARRLTDGAAGEQTPDWGTTDVLQPVRDRLPPAVVVLPASGPPARAARAGRRETAPPLRFAAIDVSGVRSVHAAIARRSARSRCRFLVRGRFAAASRCSRPRWFAARTPAAWERASRRMTRGRYRVWLRARDGAGNASRRPRAVDVGVR